MACGPSSKPAKRGQKREKAARAMFDPAAFLATVAPGREIFTYSKRDVIFSQGDDADLVFYIKKGKVKVAVLSTHGREAVVALLGPDEFLGEGCLIGQPKRLATASAMTDCEVMRVKKSELQRSLLEELAFNEIFVAHILTRIARVEEIWSISYSTRLKNAWRDCCCCWPTSARKAGPSRSLPTSVRRRSPR